MTPRDTHRAIIAAMTGLDPVLDERVRTAVIEKLGDDAFTLSDAALELMANEYRRLLEQPALPSEKPVFKVGDIVVMTKNRTVRRRIEAINTETWLWSYPHLGEFTAAGGPNLFNSDIETLVDFEVEAPNHTPPACFSPSARH
ncbi:hypothetical protein GGR34_003726 [Microvirga flocculans]|uniref:Uncharacterized protein n=1 Tax=Microvirga flocculans TaxID=217168 RepID=A0A7W6IJ49_9HYPH|nr:hypothetical protein [Microvirga flocculans]MBB4042041.1 hypothetical protein [Microvirga flocculans]